MGRGGAGGGKFFVWIAVSRQSTDEPQATHKIQTFLSTLVKCNRLKAELASCEYERLDLDFAVNMLTICEHKRIDM